MSALNDNIQAALGKKIQELAEGGGKSDPADLAVAKSIFVGLNGVAAQVEAYVGTAYGADDKTDSATVAMYVDAAIDLMKKLGILP